ncbi:hypothetical protein PPACK8108_LOCUS5407 [Phakopsora pachyrhizi]|uniref:Uncharacterized protein n=1 Tax=Phakopsora pachyrhizi TaxID=170000 RepID=A0AAV0ANT0_PHAPC|nr:hypothetical protein PPACK8108_LOCUS5407 [Phakopsora pachyrhizi]
MYFGLFCFYAYLMTFGLKTNGMYPGSNPFIIIKDAVKESHFSGTMVAEDNLGIKMNKALPVETSPRVNQISAWNAGDLATGQIGIDTKRSHDENKKSDTDEWKKAVDQILKYHGLDLLLDGSKHISPLPDSPNAFSSFNWDTHLADGYVGRDSQWDKTAKEQMGARNRVSNKKLFGNEKRKKDKECILSGSPVAVNHQPTPRISDYSIARESSSANAPMGASTELSNPADQIDIRKKRLYNEALGRDEKRINKEKSIQEKGPDWLFDSSKPTSPPPNSPDTRLSHFWNSDTQDNKVPQEVNTFKANQIVAWKAGNSFVDRKYIVTKQSHNGNEKPETKVCEIGVEKILKDNGLDFLLDNSKHISPLPDSSNAFSSFDWNTHLADAYVGRDSQWDKTAKEQMGVGNRVPNRNLVGNENLKTDKGYTQLASRITSYSTARGSSFADPPMSASSELWNPAEQSDIHNRSSPKERLDEEEKFLKENGLYWLLDSSKPISPLPDSPYNRPSYFWNLNLNNFHTNKDLLRDDSKEYSGISELSDSLNNKFGAHNTIREVEFNHSNQNSELKKNQNTLMNKPKNRSKSRKMNHRNGEISRALVIQSHGSAKSKSLDFETNSESTSGKIPNSKFYQEVHNINNERRHGLEKDNNLRSLNPLSSDPSPFKSKKNLNISLKKFNQHQFHRNLEILMFLIALNLIVEKVAYQKANPK